VKKFSAKRKATNLGSTFKENAGRWFKEVQTRMRGPIKPYTADTSATYLSYIKAQMGPRKERGRIADLVAGKGPPETLHAMSIAGPSTGIKCEQPSLKRFVLRQNLISRLEETLHEVPTPASRSSRTRRRHGFFRPRLALLTEGSTDSRARMFDDEGAVGGRVEAV
jgi:hypothetical protein